MRKIIIHAFLGLAAIIMQMGCMKMNCMMGNSGNCFPSSQQPDTVRGATFAIFTYGATSNTCNAPVSFAFNSLNGKAVSQTWQFGDGVSSNMVNPVHEFAKAGTYTVTLTMSDGFKMDSVSVTIKIQSTMTDCGC